MTVDIDKPPKVKRSRPVDGRRRRLDKEGNRRLDTDYWHPTASRILETENQPLADPNSKEFIDYVAEGRRAGAARPTDEWLSQPRPARLTRRSIPLYLQEQVNAGKARIVQAWDTALSDSNAAAYSVCVTAVLVPCNSWHRSEDSMIYGDCDMHWDVWVVDVVRERMDFGKLTQEARRLWMEWGPSDVLIEQKTSGVSLIQVLQKSGIPVKGVVVKEGKRARVENAVRPGAASVQAWFKMGRVRFWRFGCWIKEFLSEIRGFTGADDHNYADQVDALVHLVAYTIHLGVTRVMLPSADAMNGSEWGAGGLPPTWQGSDDPIAVDKALMLSNIGALDLAVAESLNGPPGPFGECCHECARWGKDQHGNPAANQWCPIQNRKTAAIESCHAFAKKLLHKDAGFTLVSSTTVR